MRPLLAAPAPRRLLRRLAATYTKAGYEIRPGCSSRSSPTARSTRDLEEPDQIKPPVVYLAGMLRQTGTYVMTDDWVWMLDGMGQRPFYPPNVSGWEQNEAWLSTSSLRMRFQAASTLLHDAIKDGSVPARRTPAQALEHSPRSPAALDEQGHDLLARRSHSRRSVAGRSESWEVKHYYPERERVLRQVLLAGPDAQVC